MSKLDINAAHAHFAATDSFMAEQLERALKAPAPLAIPTPKQPHQYFESIVSAIVGQQISTKAADAVRQRVITHLGGTITPAAVQASDFDTLKACGLSSQKTKYLKHNADIWHEIPSGNFVHMTDEDIITELTKLYGIGRWTAEMFLMFSMARPDVFSYGDLGLMQGLYELYNYHPHYTRKIATTVDAWSPHKTTASLVLWFYKDNGPVLL